MTVTTEPDGADGAHGAADGTDGADGTEPGKDDATGPAEGGRTARGWGGGLDTGVLTDGGRRAPLLVVALLGMLCVPLAVAVAVLHGPRWYPLLDLAQTELRVRDVGGGDTPLVGLAGRIQAYGQQGSHPGPLSFLSLAPFYRLLGSSSWALQAASVTLHALAMGGILAVAHRRGGARLALGFGAVLAVLLHAYGTGVFVEPWNPYMPVLWWLLFLLAIWSVVCGDVAMLPVAVFAGSFCMQTHVSYLGLVGGVAGLTVAAAAAWAFPRRRDRAALAPLARWGPVALVLGALLWVPPVIDQAVNDPGNGSMIVENFRNSPDEPVGLGTGVELVAVHLNVWRILTGELATTGSMLPAALLLAAWAASVVVARRLRHTALLRLHAVVGVVLVLGVVSASQILGELWYYLALWAWGIAALVVVATVWSFAAYVAGRDAVPARAPALGAAALAAVALVWTAMFTNDAAHAEEPAVRLSDQLAELAPTTVGALEAVEANGEEGRYLVSWSDPVGIGATGFGLLLELERQGFDVGVSEAYGTGAVRHRVLGADEATAQVHLVVGDAGIAEWEARPGAVRVAESDIRTDAQVERYAEVRRRVIDDLEADGLDELVPAVDGALMAVAIDERASAEAREGITEMADIGQPAAVFVLPL